MSLQKKRILLVITGSIAAYKSLSLIRRLQDQGADVSCVMTQAACAFITPLSVKALCHHNVFTDSVSINQEQDITHIRAAREADLILVAPATADFIAKLAHGDANDLASSLLLANDKPVFIAPAMNPTMWAHPATCRNRHMIAQDGAFFIGPVIGAMAEKECGEGRMSDVSDIIATLEAFFNKENSILRKMNVVITSGPTYESIDPIRYIGNRSSGKQGHALAAAFASYGADVSLVSGPVSLDDPKGVKVIHVKTAEEMHKAVENLLPADIAIFAAAVTDWKIETPCKQKIKKDSKEEQFSLSLIRNVDILHHVSHHSRLRPKLVIGFSAETENIENNTYKKLVAKGADFMIANNVSEENGVMGEEMNSIWIVSANETIKWPKMSKKETALQFVEFVVQFLKQKH